METGTVVTDHQMIFVVSPQQTTLYDEIKYTGSPSSFAWVLPIHGPVTVGLSSDIVFAALEQDTRPAIEPPPLTPCALPADCNCQTFGAAGSSGGSSGGTPASNVTVISQAVVGPYDTVQLQSTDPNALNAWLQANGYTISASAQPVVAAYLKEGFDFLAMKLVPGANIQAMRPVSVTTTGAGLSLPLRMVAIGTGATVGITLWVVSSGRYEPSNFPQFTISPSELVWDWNAGASNYNTLQKQKESALANAAWQIEDSLDLSPTAIESLVMNGDPSAMAYMDTTVSDAGAAQTPVQVRTQDLATLFPSGGASVRITRMRTDLSQAALANDLVLQASADQTMLSNLYQVTKSVNAPVCPSPPVCPCGTSGSSGGTSSSGVGSSGSTGGGTGTDDGGTTNGASPGQESFSCATSPGGPGSGGLELALTGLLGAALVRARVRRKP
jgi:MYXO-CTERM domain-containing protein